jgi:hypothetical protein
MGSTPISGVFIIFGIKTPISGVFILLKCPRRFSVFLFFYRLLTPKIGVYIPLQNRNKDIIF